MNLAGYLTVDNCAAVRCLSVALNMLYIANSIHADRCLCFVRLSQFMMKAEVSTGFRKSFYVNFAAIT